MKKAFRNGLLGLTGSAMLAFAAPSQADVITDIEDIDRTIGGILGIPAFGWTHVLEGFTLGTAVSGTLTIEFADDLFDFCIEWDDGRCVQRVGELTSIVVGIIDFLDGEIIFNPTSDYTGSLGAISLHGLNRTGELDVTLLPTGDFYVGRSILEITTRAVPEPATLGLLGLGLVGIGAMRRRRQT